MAILVHRYDSPDRFVAGTVGQPGERTFFLQAREGNRITSVVVEKQQVSVLAEHLDKVLDEVLRRSGPRADVPPAPEKPSDIDPLDAPITEEFRVGTMTIAWDAEHRPDRHRALLQRRRRGRAEDLGDDLDLRRGAAAELEAAEEVDADEVFVVKISAAYARDFVARAQALVSAGRPPCPFCLQPLDPAGHICPRANGYRRPLF